MSERDRYTEKMFPERLERELGIDGQIQDVTYEDGLVKIEVERTDK